MSTLNKDVFEIRILESFNIDPFSDISDLRGYDWARLLSKQPQFADKCDWNILDGYEWARLLSKQPQFADKCDWDKLSGYDWVKLLCKQPKFSNKCDWDKLNRLEVLELLGKRPKFAAKCTKFVFEFNSGFYNRILVIEKSRPTIIHIGCFKGTKSEAISRINNEYDGQEALDYIAKVESCFNKLGK